MGSPNLMKSAQKIWIGVAVVIALAALAIGAVYLYHPVRRIPSSSASIASERLLLGGWLAQESGLEEEIDFSIDALSGVHYYSSFLHQRPAESGTWSYEDGTLTIDYDDDESRDTFDTVIRTGDTLILKDSRGMSSDGVYKAIQTP